MKGLNKKTILSNIFSEKYVNKSPISREVSLVAGQFGQLIHQDTTYLTQFHQKSMSNTASIQKIHVDYIDDEESNSNI